MTADEIENIIRREIGGRWDISNAHGVDLKKCLIKPQKLLFIDSGKSQGHIELWLVLEEDPVTKDGYQIVFDERTKMFGLAATDLKMGPCFLGAYGSFLNTLEAM